MLLDYEAVEGVLYKMLFNQSQLRQVSENRSQFSCANVILASSDHDLAFVSHSVRSLGSINKIYPSSAPYPFGFLRFLWLRYWYRQILCTKDAETTDLY